MVMDRKIWQKHESDLQEALNLSPTVGSGNQFHDIGDGSTIHNRLVDFPMVIDCKCTEKKSYSLSSELLEDWLRRAEEQGKMFLLPVRFQHAKVKDYVVIQLDDLLMLLLYAKKGLND
jgi:hypothetical protein